VSVTKNPNTPVTCEAVEDSGRPLFTSCRAIVGQPFVAAAAFPGGFSGTYFDAVNSGIDDSGSTKQGRQGAHDTL